MKYFSYICKKLNIMNIHYIYQHIRLDTNEVFYIGKGVQKKYNYKYYRAFDTKRRNNIWKNIVNKTDYKVEILFTNLTEIECFKIEIELISKYGKIFDKSGTLANYTNGGEGQLRFHKKSIKQIESANKAREIAWKLPRTVKQIKAVTKNISKANPEKPVLQYDLNMNLINEYKSTAEAARSVGGNHGNISMCCNNKRKTAYKFIWKFKN